MKVIKHGNTKSIAPEIVTKRTTCPICGCEFEYGSDETCTMNISKRMCFAPSVAGIAWKKKKFH